MTDHNITHEWKGEGITATAKPVCSCGWQGWTESQSNDYFHSNLADQERDHLKNIADIQRKFGDLLQEVKSFDYGQTLDAVNRFFNKRIMFLKDQTDYFQTLIETLERGAGDCEDYAIAKYKTLQGLNIYDLHLAYVLTPYDQAHMVCICGEYVLDNLCEGVYYKADLYQLIYMFDDENLIIGNRVENARQHLSRWDDVLNRMTG